MAVRFSLSSVPLLAGEHWLAHRTVCSTFNSVESLVPKMPALSGPIGFFPLPPPTAVGLYLGKVRLQLPLPPPPVGHASHVMAEFDQSARLNSIIMLCIPPHSSHVMLH